MNIKKLFDPPVFSGDEEKTHQAALLNTSIWTIITLLMLISAGNLIGRKIPFPVNLLNAVLLGLCLVVLYWMHKGHLKIACTVLVLTGIAHLTVGIILLGTVRTPTTMGYILAVVIAGLQFGRRGTVLTTVGISLILSGLILAEQRGLLPEPDFSVGITQWISYTATLGFTGNLTLLAVSMVKKSLQHAQQELEKRKQVEETLRIFSRAMEHSSASIVITDTEGNIQNANPKFLQLTGYKLEEVVGENPRILKSGEQSNEFYEQLWNTITSGKEWHGEFHNKKKNGALYWEKASISPVFDENGMTTHYIAVKEDVTEQKQVRESLEHANRQLQAQLAQINELTCSLREQATRDSLTGLHNRRYFDEMIKKEFSRAKREGHPISLVIFDLDHLKEINDTGGHPTGDQALRGMANHLLAHTRAEDTVTRNGGDEFAVIMPKTTPADALKRANEWLTSISSITLLHHGDKVLKITFTAGIASYPAHGETIEEVLNYADVALYRAKARGRSRVEIFSPENTIPTIRRY